MRQYVYPMKILSDLHLCLNAWLNESVPLIVVVSHNLVSSEWKINAIPPILNLSVWQLQEYAGGKTKTCQTLGGFLINLIRWTKFHAHGMISILMSGSDAALHCIAAHRKCLMSCSADLFSGHSLGVRSELWCGWLRIPLQQLQHDSQVRLLGCCFSCSLCY